MNNKIRQLAVIFGALTLVLATPAYSAPITFSFSGVVTNYFYDPVTSDPFGGTVSTGTTFTGFYVFDSTTIDTFPDATIGAYHNVLPPYGMEATIGGNTVSGLGSDMLIDLNNFPSGDSYSAIALDILGYQSLGIQLSDGPATVFSDDSLPLSPPDITSFTEALFYYQRADPLTGSTTVTVVGTLTELTRVPEVPEPTSLALMALGLIGLGFIYKQKAI